MAKCVIVFEDLPGGELDVQGMTNLPPDVLAKAAREGRLTAAQAAQCSTVEFVRDMLIPALKSQKNVEHADMQAQLTAINSLVCSVLAGTVFRQSPNGFQAACCSVLSAVIMTVRLRTCNYAEPFDPSAVYDIAEKMMAVLTKENEARVPGRG